MEKAINREQDNYRFVTDSETELLQEVQEMEQNSRWLPGVPSKKIHVLPLEPIEVPIVVQKIADDPMLTRKVSLDAAMEAADPAVGSHFIMTNEPNAWVLRDTAISSLHNTAKLFGSAFSRMTPYCSAEVLNNGLRAAPDKSLTLLLERYGRIAALHSDNGGGYRVMPISELLSATTRKLNDRFGKVEFLGGENSHSATACMWALPDKQDEMLTIYEDALDAHGITSVHSMNMMPVVKFFSSDTGNSCATAVPYFQKPAGNCVRFTDGIAVKHTRNSSGKDGVPAFEEALDGLYAQFTDMTEALDKLTSVQIEHPENVLIGLSNKLGLPKKYADEARKDLTRLTAGMPFVPMHDVYLSMSDIPFYAKEAGASQTTITNLEEQVAKILHMDKEWSRYDIGGTVEWGRQSYIPNQTF